MVTAQNAYWLNFFLKREINVVIWNYRGYGESTLGLFDFYNPSKAKRDAERVLAHSISYFQLEGKMGLYGRSIGGIVATHLGAKYCDLIEVMMIDRSLSEM
jgi:pimeloyl-ACP methyl ester carboxylesterase